MTLQARFFAWFKPYLDKLMHAAQRNKDIDLESWEELQTDYKNIYGKTYERTN